MSGPLKYDYKKLKGDPADAPGLSSYIVGLALPIAGGTMAGNLDMDHYQISNVQAIDSDEITLNGLPVATEQFASNASNLTSGTVPDDRLSANVPRLNAASNAFTGLIDTSRTNAAANRYQWRSDDGGQWAIATGGVAGASGFRVVRPGVADMAMFIANSGMTIYGSITSSTGVINVGSGVSIVRNATGPTLDVCAAGGLRVRNADGSGPAPAVFDAWHATSGGRHIVLGGSFVQIDKALYMNTTPIYLNPSGTTSISFASAGVAQIGTTAANALGSLNLTNLTASGNINLATTSQINNGAAAWPIVLMATQSAARIDTGSNKIDLIPIGSSTLEIRVPGSSSQNSAAPSGALATLSIGNVTLSGVEKFTGYPTSLLPAAASNAGSITYDTTISKHVGCNGSSWNALW